MNLNEKAKNNLINLKIKVRKLGEDFEKNFDKSNERLWPIPFRFEIKRRDFAAKKSSSSTLLHF